MWFFFEGKQQTLRNVYAEYPDMVMNASPNPVGSGARAMGIGGAFISIADDATAASWNPGGLLHLKRPEISIVGSFFSGKSEYETFEVDGDIEDRFTDIKHLNYLSAAIPFTFFRRNFVFSINYQHLYEFSQEIFLSWRELNPETQTDIDHSVYKNQEGSLYTISPALAIEITSSFFVGLTFNFWDDDILDNGWENLTVQYAEGTDLRIQKKYHSEIFERYEFSGFNMHLGFLYHCLWGDKNRFRVGGIIKTPFNADIQHERRAISRERSPNDPIENSHLEWISSKNLILKMPLSYGLGISFDFSDTFSLAFDLYRTHWNQYLLVYPSGIERSPINKELEDHAHIKSTIQIRLGAEYLIFYNRFIIPIRSGFFYDPEPASGDVDNFYGCSFGTGISFKSFAFDIAYLYRIGEKRDVEDMLDQKISSDIKQHYLHTSMIFYF